MAVSNRTSEFRDILREKERDIPEARRRKLSRSAKRTGDEQKDVQETLNKEYVAEGYNIVRMSSITRTILVPKAKPAHSLTISTHCLAC